MTPRQIRLVQKTWKQVVPISDWAAADRTAELFYGRLFQLDPGIRRLFKSDMKEQGRKLVEIITIAVNCLSKLESLVSVVEDLGRRHIDYGVTEVMFDTVGEALFWTLKQGLGPAFTADVEAAWTETYNTLADVMKSAAYAHA